MLSARRISTTYLTETMIVSVQKTSDSTPKMLSGVERHVAVGEDLLQRVQRAGADVAVDDADGAERQRGEAGGGAGLGHAGGAAPERRAAGAASKGRLLCLAARRRQRAGPTAGYS